MRDKSTEFFSGDVVAILNQEGFPELTIRMLKLYVQLGYVTPKRYADKKKSRYVYTREDIEQLKAILALHYANGLKSTQSVIKASQDGGNKYVTAIVADTIKRYQARLNALIAYSVKPYHEVTKS